MVRREIFPDKQIVDFFKYNLHSYLESPLEGQLSTGRLENAMGSERLRLQAYDYTQRLRPVDLSSADLPK